MSDIIKLSGLVIIAAISALSIKNANGTAARAIAIAGTVLALGFSVSSAAGIVSELRSQLDFNILGSYGKRMIKALGVSLTVKVAADICLSCGESTVANGIEMAGKLEILLICLPTVYELVSLLNEI